MSLPRSPSTYQIALGLLARRELSTSQLRHRLTRRDLPRSEIEAAITRLARERAVDDTRMALSYARRAAEVKLRGQSRTRRDIEALGIDAATAGRAVAAVFDEVDEESVLERAIAKRLDGAIRDRTQFRRLSQALLRQGFPPDRVAAALVVRTQGNVDMSGFLDVDH
ncbi:MAG: RecX family transcriptional regulator [Acidobacteria bacterium]|nr:RecX family transcriptional regulator [Acidobacteriota bacterium]